MRLRPRCFTVRNVVKFSILFCVAVNLCLLVYNPPKIFEKPCPLVLPSINTHTNRDVSLITAGVSVNCTWLFQRNHSYSALGTYKWCRRHDGITESRYVKLAGNCEYFRQQHGYLQHPVEEEEREFPIAFSIMMHESVEQTERLLRAIYRPHNAYCVHVDDKAPLKVRTAMTAIVQCLPNVTLASSPVQVHWAEFSVLEAELACLNDLWNHTWWKYYINLSEREFPLRTNLELVKILKAYNGGNEVDGSIMRRPTEWTEYSYRKEYWRSNKRKPPAPHAFHVAKGSAHVAISRSFVDFALHNPKSVDLLAWMQDIRAPDEHFFATLNNNPQMDIPGAYTGNPDLRDGFYVRYKQWYNPTATCHGKWQRFICVLGAGDLHLLSGSKHMFVNKIDIDFDPVAFQCLEQLYRDRVHRINNPDFDIEFYKSRKLVTHHV